MPHRNNHQWGTIIRLWFYIYIYVLSWLVISRRTYIALYYIALQGFKKGRRDITSLSWRNNKSLYARVFFISLFYILKPRGNMMLRIGWWQTIAPPRCRLLQSDAFFKLNICKCIYLVYVCMVEENKTVLPTSICI